MMVDATYDEIFSAALTLSPNLRAMLAEQLLTSLDAVEQHEIDAAWAKEAEKRVLELTEGQVQSISGKQVMQELRSRHKK